MIEGPRVNLRHVVKIDIPRLLPLMNNVALKGEFERITMQSPEQLERQIFTDGLSTRASEMLLVVDKVNNILGAVWHAKAVPTFNSRELGYMLYAVDQRGTGITTEAVKLLVDYVFKTEQVNRLELRMHTQNIASERIAMKCGFTKEGIAREARFIQGRNVDVYEYSLLRREWEQGRANLPGASAEMHEATAPSAAHEPE